MEKHEQQSERRAYRVVRMAVEWNIAIPISLAESTQVRLVRRTHGFLDDFATMALNTFHRVHTIDCLLNFQDCTLHKRLSVNVVTWTSLINESVKIFKIGATWIFSW